MRPRETPPAGTATAVPATRRRAGAIAVRARGGLESLRADLCSRASRTLPLRDSSSSLFPDSCAAQRDWCVLCFSLRLDPVGIPSKGGRSRLCAASSFAAHQREHEHAATDHNPRGFEGLAPSTIVSPARSFTPTRTVPKLNLQQARPPSVSLSASRRNLSIIAPRFRWCTFPDIPLDIWNEYLSGRTAVGYLSQEIRCTCWFLYAVDHLRLTFALCGIQTAPDTDDLRDSSNSDACDSQVTRRNARRRQPRPSTTAHEGHSRRRQPAQWTHATSFPRASHAEEEDVWGESSEGLLAFFGTSDPGQMSSATGESRAGLG